jgi:hypothetical protein
MTDKECLHENKEHIADNSAKSAGSIYWCPDCGALRVDSGYGYPEKEWRKVRQADMQDRGKDRNGTPSWGLSFGGLSEYVRPQDVYLCDEHFNALGDCWEYTICTALISWHDCSVSGCDGKAAHMCALSDMMHAAKQSGIKITLRERAAG